MTLESSKIRVACIGAGFAGLALAKSILDGAPGAELTIYEANEGVGGVWLKLAWIGRETSRSYLSFLSDTVSWGWKRFPFSPRAEWISPVFKHKVESAVWDEQEGMWSMKGSNHSNIPGEAWQAKAHVLVNAGGILSKANKPAIAGAETFLGTLVHTSQWKPDISTEDRRVAVVGHIDLYVRSQAWIETGDFATLVTDDVEVVNPAYSEEQRNSFKMSKGHVEQHRKWLEEAFHGSARDLYIRGSPTALFVRDALTKLTQAKLTAKPALESSIVPAFSFGCRRPTPGPGFFETITASNVEVIQAGVARITPAGIIAHGDVSERERPADVIVLATGYKVDHVPSFDVTGRSNASLSLDYRLAPDSTFPSQVFEDLSAPIVWSNFEIAALPKLYVIHGGEEALLNEGVRFVARAKAQEVDVTHVIYPGYPHDFFSSLHYGAMSKVAFCATKAWFDRQT
ncbi:FAD/NAD(P)-binding domain-containing protein [Acaromyces ingoldii]|uniref:FAD/NAD(P)-binding domain-containing protein n=1 Tax=Acaromyces ingoldii TaxID=215250 RepID=A0A316YA15_9BASI|nr:FAD/NAD(P)-binding domain-containing protein [Acaromyces ingoldii]PWN86710.1 FAD/NAD(P)-binding domain-containing protein [Acaromyces ingoldii]